MKCQQCNNQAIVTYAMNQNGKLVQHAVLCSDCSHAIYAQTPLGSNNDDYDTIDSFFSMMDNTTLNPNFFLDVFKPTNQECCPNCATTYQAYLNTGILGCEQCYFYFEEQLFPLLKKIQRGNLHTGREMGKFDLTSEKQKKQTPIKKKKVNKPKTIDEMDEQDLIKIQKEAILKEDYEKAAEIRDRIKALKNEKDKGEM